ncbi:MAG: hypothetical protein ACI8XO_003342 [Verrucomicrobiales bacterium]|jgi:hypothetical protein
MSYESVYGTGTGNGSNATSPRPPSEKGPSAYGGLGRFSYLLVMICIYGVFYFALSATMLEYGGAVLIAGLVFLGSMSFVAGTLRLTNQNCESPFMLMLAGVLIPIVNLYVAWRLIACQEGYVNEGELDSTGKLMTYSIGAIVLTLVARGVTLSL